MRSNFYTSFSKISISTLTGPVIDLVLDFQCWAISGAVIHGAIKQQAETTFHQKSILEVEREIQQKETMRDRYFQTDRLSLARKYDLELNSLKQKLEEVRKLSIKSPSSIMIWNTLGTLVIFRILVMLSNVF
jgi:hypothetical protein